VVVELIHTSHCLITECNSNIDIIGSTADDATVCSVGERTRTVCRGAVLAHAIAAIVVAEAARYRELMRWDQRDISGTSAGVFQSYLNQGARLAIVSAITSLEVGNQSKEGSVASVRTASGENIAVLSSQIRSSISAVVSKRNGVGLLGVDLHEHQNSSEEGSGKLGEHIVATATRVYGNSLLGGILELRIRVFYEELYTTKPGPSKTP